MFNMPGNSYQGPLLPLTEEEITIQTNLVTHIQQLAGEIGERNIWHYQNLQAATHYIETIFNKLGYTVTEQSFITNTLAFKNLIVEHRGVTHPDEIIIVGAHYDTVFGSPGADDNASGVAAILEFARQLITVELNRTVRFVAFVNEESPFFYTKDMGSFHYARQAKEKNDNIVAMLSIESIGYYVDHKNSQQYPFPFRFFYPDKANFIGFVGNVASRGLVRQAIASFRQHSLFPSEGVAAPGWMTGIGWSDQWAFWRHGYHAIMITGTALFRNANYHTEKDTPDTIDYPRTARVINGLAQVIKDLAAGET